LLEVAHADQSPETEATEDELWQFVNDIQKKILSLVG
jgi:hypothetical protein